MNSADGISAADHVAVPVGGHAHYNWGFTTNGVHEVVLQAFGQRVGISTNDFSLPTALRFEVEPLPGDTVRVLVFDGGPVTTARPVYLRLEVRLD